MVSPGGDSNLGTATLRLRAGDQQLKKDLAKAEDMTKKRLERFSRKAQSAGLLAAGVGAALTIPLALSVKTFAQFEQSMANVRAVSGATASEFTSLTDIAKEMGATTVFTANQSAQALSFMSMAGLSAKNSIAALPAVLNVAAAGQLELADSADIVTNIMAGYGIAAAGVSRATDVLVTGFTSANTNLLQLGEAFTYAGPLAKAAGLTFEETAAALSLMGNAGFQGSLAGTSLRGAIVRLLTPTTQAAEIMQRLGVNVKNASGDLLPFIDILTQFEKAGLSAGDAMDIFGRRSGAPMLALVSQGSGALRQLTMQMENSGGTAERIARQQLDTFHGQMTLLKSAIDGLSISIGSTLVPVLRNIVKIVTPVVGGFTRWAEKNKELATGIVVIVGALGTFLLVGGLTIVMAGILAASLNALGLSFAVLWTAILGPVGLAIAGVAAIIALAVILYKKFDAVRNLIDKITLGIFRMGDATKSVEPGETRKKVQAAQQGLPGADAMEDMGDEMGKQMVEVASSLITGRTRWTNVREQEAQENQFDRVIRAIEKQTKDLENALEIELHGIEMPEPGGPSWWDKIKALDWGNWITEVLWGNWIVEVFWGNWITEVLWGNWIVEVFWGDWIVGLAWLDWIKEVDWGTFIKEVLWPNFITVLLWPSFVAGLFWRNFIEGVIWRNFIEGVIWRNFIKGVIWRNIIKGVIWRNIIKGVIWRNFIKGVIWRNFIKGVIWRNFIEGVIWRNIIKGVIWRNIIKGVIWRNIIKGVIWRNIIKGVIWRNIIKGVIWRNFIKGVIWRNFIQGFLWNTVVKKLFWSWFIQGLLWNTFIKGFLWNTVIQGFLWNTVIKKLFWSWFVPNFSWPTLPKFKWPTIKAPRWPRLRVPGFHSGGIAMSPMLATVAEEKPEAIVPLDRLESMIRGMGGRGGDFNMYGDFYGYEDFVEKVTDAGFLFGRRGG